MPHLLALDQGTSSSRAIVYDHHGRVLGQAQAEFKQHYPSPGWVEHDADDIWGTVLGTATEALHNAGLTGADLAAIGITNQRETIVLWDRRTGAPVHHAIVWQDRRTHEFIESLKKEGRGEDIQARTGLQLDPYFSASKLRWLLNQVPGARERAQKGELAAGTIDTWLAWKLSNGRAHITDISNASRTMLMDIHKAAWDPELLRLFDIPASVLPQIVSSSGRLAECDAAHFGTAVPLCGLIGDQQSALFGQLCTEPGMVKSTYGTGCFMLMFTGKNAIPSKNRLLTTVAWRIGNEEPCYALEGSVFVGGAAIQWLRDGLKIIGSAPEINQLAASVPDSGGVYFVPALTGLGAPVWDAAARGTITGLTRGSTGAHLARATLDAIAHQVIDLVSAMESDSGRELTVLRVDGGAAASDLLMQIQADLLDVPVERPANIETTALGAVYMAGLGAGVWKDIDHLKKERKIDRVFRPEMDPSVREARRKRWKKAIECARGWTDGEIL